MTVDLSTTTTTAPPRAPASCEQVGAFAAQLATVDVLVDPGPSPSPDELATRARLVVRGDLTGGQLVSNATATAGLGISYDINVTEVLQAAPGVEVRPGEVIGVAFSFATEGPETLPPLGDGAELSSPHPMPDGAVPVVAFVTDERAPTGIWVVAGPDALAIGCPDQPIGGLVGEGPGWADVGDLDALAELVRDR